MILSYFLVFFLGVAMGMCLYDELCKVRNKKRIYDMGYQTRTLGVRRKNEE